MADYIEFISAVVPVLHIPADSEHGDLYTGHNNIKSFGNACKYVVDSAKWNYTTLDSGGNTLLSGVVAVFVLNSGDADVTITFDAVSITAKPGMCVPLVFASAEEVIISPGTGKVLYITP